MKLRDLVTAPDGSLSLTKLAAATAHFLMAASFLRLQVLGEHPFNEALWLVYGGFAIAHAAYDKTAAMVKDFKEQKLDATQGTPSTESRP
jgi:hypothetical protein